MFVIRRSGLFLKRTSNLLPKPIISKYSTSSPQTTSSSNENLTLSGDPINPMHGSNHWNFERIISIASLGVISTAAIYPHSMVDFALGFIIPLHCHIGFGAIVTDYLPKRKFPAIYTFSRGVLYASTALTMYGLYKYNTEDVGIIEGVKKVWGTKKLIQGNKSEEEN